MIITSNVIQKSENKNLRLFLLHFLQDFLNLFAPTFRFIGVVYLFNCLKFKKIYTSMIMMENVVESCIETFIRFHYFWNQVLFNALELHWMLCEFIRKIFYRFVRKAVGVNSNLFVFLHVFENKFIELRTFDVNLFWWIHYSR